MTEIIYLILLIGAGLSIAACSLIVLAATFKFIEVVCDRIDRVDRG